MNIQSILNNNNLRNSLWMVSEKIVSIFGLIFVTSFVAKYIGPTNFGKLTYASSIFAIVRVVAMLGTDDVIFQRITKNVVFGEKIIYATKFSRECIFFFTSVLLIAYLYFTADQLTFLFSLGACVSVYFTTKDVFSIYFNAILKSKMNTISNVVGLTISLVVRYLIALFKLPLEFLILPIILVSFIPYIVRLYFFNKMNISKKSSLTKYQKKKIRYSMISIGKKLIFYALSVEIFTKTSQLFLGSFSQHDLGIYTVAATLGTSFHFVLNAVITSFMSKVYNEKDLLKRRVIFSKINIMVLLISSCSFFFILFFGKYLVVHLYGLDYIDSLNLIYIMIFVCLFSGLSMVSEKYILSYSKSGYVYLKYKTLVLVFSNIISSYLLIKYFGAYGAAYSLLLTEILSTTIFNYFFRSFEIFKAQFHYLIPSKFR